MDQTPNQSAQKSQKENSNPAIRREAIRREMALSDEKSRLSDAKKEGIEKGKKRRYYNSCKKTFEQRNAAKRSS